MQQLVCIQRRDKPPADRYREDCYSVWWRYGCSALYSTVSTEFDLFKGKERVALILSPGASGRGGLGDTFIYPQTLLSDDIIASSCVWVLEPVVHVVSAADVDELLRTHVARAIGTKDEYVRACRSKGLKRSSSAYGHARLRGCAYPLPGPGRIPIVYPVPGTKGMESDESFYSPKSLLEDGMALHDAGILMLPEVYEKMLPLLKGDAELYIDLVNVPSFR